MGDSRGAGARAAGQTDTVGLCHIACSSNIGYQVAKNTVADTPALALALTLTLTAFREKSTGQRRNTTSSLGSRPDSLHHLRQPSQHRSSPLGAPCEDSQSRCVDVDLTRHRRLRSSASFGILRDLPPLFSGGFLFSNPLFSRFPHGSPCYPRHPSAWFNYSWKSSSVLCRSAAVMFDAAKETSESQLILAISECILRLVLISRNHFTIVSVVAQAIRHCAHIPNYKLISSH